ncbi:MAG: DUF3887 domain-containing protein [Acidimicrobiales bacterium]
MTDQLDATGNDVERDVLRLMLKTNAGLLADRLAQGLADQGDATSDEGAVIAALAAATGLGSVLDDIVVALVRQARAEGRSWAAIGYALQVSRQAAFQRFGSRAGDTLEVATAVLADAPERAERALRHFLAGEFQALRADFNQRMTENCPVSLLESVRSHLTKELGEVRKIGMPSVTSRPGYSVADIPITYRKGERKGRIALDPDGRIAGFFVLGANFP